MPSQTVALLLTSLLALEPVRASLDIDADALGEAGPAVAERLTVRGERVLRDGDVLPGQGSDDVLISVHIDTLSDAIGYRYAATVTRGGELVPGMRVSAECRTCSEAELATQLDETLARLVERLQPEDDEAELPSPVVVPAPAAPESIDRGWTVGSMGGAGIALTGIGGLAMGLGIGLAVAEPVLLKGNAERNSTVSVAGLAVAVGGVALAATGIALIFTERGRSRRRSSAHWDGPSLRF